MKTLAKYTLESGNTVTLQHSQHWQHCSTDNTENTGNTENTVTLATLATLRAGSTSQLSQEKVFLREKTFSKITQNFLHPTDPEINTERKTSLSLTNFDAKHGHIVKMLRLAFFKVVF